MESVVVQPGGANSSAYSAFKALPPGQFLTVVTPLITSGTPVHGRYFARVLLVNDVRPNLVASVADIVAVVWEGYVDNTHSSFPNKRIGLGQGIMVQCWAGTNGAATDVCSVLIDTADQPDGGSTIYHEAPGSGDGDLLSLAVSAPAAGNQQIYTLLSSVRQRIRTYKGTVTVANSGAARPISFSYTDGSNTYLTMATGAFGTLTINATDVLDLYDGPLPSDAAGATTSGCVTEPAKIKSGWTFQTAIGNLVAGDQINAARLTAEEWVYPNP